MKIDFEELYRRFFKDVYFFVLSMSRDPHTAEEITQETFFRALKEMRHFKGNCSVTSWLCQIARNLYMDQLRREKRLVREETAGDSLAERQAPVPDISDACIRKAESLSIYRVLLSLYKDSVCSDATKDMVEDHLSGCEGCREYYEQMSGELPEISSGEEGSPQIAEDWSFFKKAGQRLIYRPILFASAAVLLLLIPYSIYSVFSSSQSPLIDAAREKVLEAVPFLDRRIPVEDIEVHDAYQLEDGSVCVTFSVHSYISSFESTYILTDQGDGPALDFSSWGDSNGLSLKKYWSDFHQADTVSTLCFVLPAEPSVYRGDPAEELEPVTISSGGAYFVGKGGKILPLYEEGDAIATAPADIQTQVEEQAAIAYADTPGSLEGGTEVIDHSFFYFLSLNGEK